VVCATVDPYDIAELVPIAVLASEASSGEEGMYHVIEDPESSESSWYEGPAFAKLVLRGEFER